MTISLKGKRGLIVGIANDKSIAWGCAKVFREQGAELAITYLNDKAKVFVAPLAKKVRASLILPLNVQSDAQLKAVFAAIVKKWGRLDFLLHAVAYCPNEDLRGRTIDCSREGFLTAMDISCHSFIRMAKLVEPLMKKGGTLLTVGYLGSQRVIEGYNVMGPVKAALDGTVKYLAAELGQKNIRVNSISPGPISTRAASGIVKFDVLAAQTRSRAILKRQLTIEEVGALAAFLVSDDARHITGQTAYIDGGHSVMG